MAHKIKFYTDEHTSHAVIAGLWQRGVDVLSIHETKMYGASDDEHLARAIEERRVIITHDADFLRLNAANKPHFGIAFAHRYTAIGDIIRGIMLIGLVFDQDEMRDRVEYI
ncbi:MAG: DUF5615 family PIN-like protein [Chloroflexota bacterium]